MAAAWFLRREVLVAAIVLAAGCGGGEKDALQITLTDESCSSQGDTEIPPGLFVVAVRNESRSFATFALWELADDATLEDLEQVYRRARRSFERTGLWPTPTELDRPVSAAEVSPGDTSELPANEIAGRFVVVCLVHPSVESAAGGPPARVYPAVELEVESVTK